MCWILELYFLLREKICTLRNVEKVADRLMARHSIYVIYIYMHIHTVHTHTHTHTLPYIKNSMYTICTILWMYTLYAVIIVYLYISLFWCEPTLQIQMTKKFVGCIDCYCKFQGSNYFCLCFIQQTKLSMFFLFL